MLQVEKLEELPHRESTSRSRKQDAREYRGLSSRPLCRYLRSRVGQEWNKVFSAVLHHPQFGHRLDIRDLLTYLVITPSEHRGPHQLWDQLYIDDDGVLRFSAKKPHKRRQPKKRFVDMDNDELASPIKGIWYAFTVKPYTLSELDQKYDIVSRKFQGQLGEIFYRPDKQIFNRVIAKRQLGKREKKRVLEQLAVGEG